MSEVTLPGGQKITVLDQADAVTVSEGGTDFFKKEDRSKLTDDKRNDLFSRAIYQKQKKYELLNLYWGPNQVSRDLRPRDERTYDKS